MASSSKARSVVLKEQDSNSEYSWDPDIDDSDIEGGDEMHVQFGDVDGEWLDVEEGELEDLMESLRNRFSLSDE